MTKQVDRGLWSDGPRRYGRGLPILGLAVMAGLAVSLPAVSRAADDDERKITAEQQVETLSRLLRELEVRSDQLQEALERSETRRREETLVREGRAMREQLREPDRLELAWSLNDAGLLMQMEGRLETARLLFDRALQLVERHLDPMHPVRGTVLQSLGEVLLALGEPSAATRFQEAALVFGTTAGTEHPRLAAVLNTWAMALNGQGRPEEAEALYRRAIRIYELQKQGGATDLVAPLYNLGLLLTGLGRADEAGKLLDRALAVLKKHREMESRRTLAVLQALARQRVAAGREREAERFEHQAETLAVRMLETTTGKP